MASSDWKEWGGEGLGALAQLPSPQALNHTGKLQSLHQIPKIPGFSCYKEPILQNLSLVSLFQFRRSFQSN